MVGFIRFQIITVLRKPVFTESVFKKKKKHLYLYNKVGSTKVNYTATDDLKHC